MAKVKVELEHTDWQIFLMLVGQGYNGVCQRINEQLVASNPPVPRGNGEERPEPPGGNA
jgi:hypothetical protein